MQTLTRLQCFHLVAMIEDSTDETRAHYFGSVEAYQTVVDTLYATIGHDPSFGEDLCGEVWDSANCQEIVLQSVK